jgi:hypothetical protein
MKYLWQALLMLAYLGSARVGGTFSKKDGVFVVDKTNNFEIVESVFLEEGVILIGVGKRKNAWENWANWESA